MTEITIAAPRFVAGLLLLWLPRGALRAGPVLRRRRRRSASHSWTHAPQDGTVLTAGYEFTKARNYVDLARAAAGMVAVAGGYGLPPAIAITGEGAVSPLTIPAAVAAVAVLAQTVRRDHRRWSLSAPVFFAAGVTLALQPGLPGLCAFALAWALVPVLPNTRGFMSVQAVVFTVLAVFLAGLSPLALAGALACLLPVVLSVLSGRPLMILSSRARSSRP